MPGLSGEWPKGGFLGGVLVTFYWLLIVATVVAIIGYLREKKYKEKSSGRNRKESSRTEKG